MHGKLAIASVTPSRRPAGDLVDQTPQTYGFPVDYSDVDFESEARKKLESRSSPGQILIDAAEGVSLLVVGSRWLGAFAGMLLSSTSQHWVHHAPTPVVVIRNLKERRA